MRERASQNKHRSAPRHRPSAASSPRLFQAIGNSLRNWFACRFDRTRSTRSIVVADRIARFPRYTCASGFPRGLRDDVPIDSIRRQSSLAVLMESSSPGSEHVGDRRHRCSEPIRGAFCGESRIKKQQGDDDRIVALVGRVRVTRCSGIWIAGRPSHGVPGAGSNLGNRRDPGCDWAVGASAPPWPRSDESARGSL